MRIKTIDIQAKEWFDRINGNSYFAAVVTINFGLSDEQTIKLPFQYGYEKMAYQVAIQKLIELGLLPKEREYDYFKKNGIEVNYSKKENCLKSELKGVA